MKPRFCAGGGNGRSPGGGARAAAVSACFNRPGVEARYLAETAEGALLEYKQESPLLPPATFRVTAQEFGHGARR
jgi:hypothetical protein